jgi:hypothetical protein
MTNPVKMELPALELKALASNVRVMKVLLVRPVQRGSMCARNVNLVREVQHVLKPSQLHFIDVIVLLASEEVIVN